jgi:hypothetical protein
MGGKEVYPVKSQKEAYLEEVVSSIVALIPKMGKINRKKEVCYEDAKEADIRCRLAVLSDFRGKRGVGRTTNLHRSTNFSTIGGKPGSVLCHGHATDHGRKSLLHG